MAKAATVTDPTTALEQQLKSIDKELDQIIAAEKTNDRCLIVFDEYAREEVEQFDRIETWVHSALGGNTLQRTSEKHNVIEKLIFTHEPYASEFTKKLLLAANRPAIEKYLHEHFRKALADGKTAEAQNAEAARLRKRRVELEVTREKICNEFGTPRRKDALVEVITEYDEPSKKFNAKKLRQIKANYDAVQDRVTRLQTSRADTLFEINKLRDEAERYEKIRLSETEQERKRDLTEKIKNKQASVAEIGAEIDENRNILLARGALLNSAHAFLSERGIQVDKNFF